MSKKIKLKLEGLHCQSCQILIESEIKPLRGIKNIKVDFNNEEAEIEYNESEINKAKIIEAIEKLNYKVVGADHNEDDQAGKKSAQTAPFWKGLAIPVIILILVGGYFLITNLGGFELLAKLNDKNIGYGLILIIGILASFHCVGMCGGLVVAYSANNLQDEKQKKSLKPHFHYNLGRLISYTIIGGILGGIGSFFGINPTFTGILVLLAGTFMILMGLSFIFNWKILQKIKIRTPQFIAKYLFSQKANKKSKGPFLIGLMNGFMPCGPLQAMELYALASGSMLTGALSLGIYALGTIPLMFGFGAFLSFISNTQIKKIIKISGLLVVILGVVMLNRGLTNFGYGFSFSQTNNQPQKNVSTDVKEYQTVKMDLSYLGYKPNILRVKKGVPVRWIINAKQLSGCTNAIMIEDLDIYQDLKAGENIIEFTPQKAGELKFSCWMRMVWGKFIVEE